MPPKTEGDVPQANTERTLPFNFPASMTMAAIRDEAAQQLLAEEAGLRARRNELRDDLRRVLDERDKAMRDLRPRATQDQPDLSATLDALHRKKDELYLELDQLRGQQDAISQAREGIRELVIALQGLNKEINEADMLLRDETRELDRLRSMGNSAKTQAQQKRVEKFASTLSVKQSEKKEKEAELQTRRATMDSLSEGETPDQRNEHFREVRDQINDVQTTLAEMKRKRQSERPDNSVLDGLRAKQEEIRLAMKETDDRLDEIRQSLLPWQHFTYPPELKMELVGRGGVTLRQMQLDFGVAICVDGIEAGHGFVVGGEEDVAACVKAIDQVMTEVQLQSKKITIPFDPAMKRQLIGVRGATIEGFERESGARVRAMDDTIEVTGTEESIDKARELIEEFLDSFHTAEMPYDRRYINLIIGKGGETIRKVMEDTGVRTLRVDRERNVLVASGHKAAVEAALQHYRDILGDAKGSGSSIMHCDDAMMRMVIGRRGRTVREIEESTGSRITCEQSTITINGSPEAVAAARARIADLHRVELRVPVAPAMMSFVTAPIVAADEAASEEAEGGASESAAGPSTRYISPLEAIMQTTQCDQMVPLRAEGCVVIRGRPNHANQAAVILRELIMRNTPRTLKVTYLEVLRGVLLRRVEGSTLLDKVTSHYSPLLRIELDRETRTLLVSSSDEEEARAAATELASTLNEIAAKQVRVISHFPEDRIGTLLGPRGATIRDLQRDTGTEIAIVKELGQVHVLQPNGDKELLDKAVDYIQKQVLRRGDEEEEGGEAVPAE